MSFLEKILLVIIIRVLAAKGFPILRIYLRSFSLSIEEIRIQQGEFLGVISHKFLYLSIKKIRRPALFLSNLNEF